MDQDQKIIARNTTFYSFALLFQKAFAFVFFAFLARELGDVDLGKYVFALSFTALFAVFTDIGFSNVLILEVAKDKTKAKQHLSNTLSTKLPLAVFNFLLIVLLINLLDYPELTKTLVYISSFVMLFDSFSLTFYSVFRGYEKLKYESLSIVIYQALFVCAGFSVLKMGLDQDLTLKLLVGSLVLASFFNMIFAITFLKIKLDLTPKLTFDWIFIKKIYKIALPFALAGIFVRIYMNADTVLLSKLAGDKYVGWYSIPNKIILALRIVPMAFASSIFPAMSKFFGEKNKELQSKTFHKSFQYLLVLSLPMAAGIFFLAPSIVRLIWPDFENSILPLQISIISIIFIFLSIPNGALLNSSNMQGRNAFNEGVTMIISVAVNLILIIKLRSYGLGALGASIALVITNLALFLLGLFYVPRIINPDIKLIVSQVARVLFATFIMSIAIYFLKDSLNIILLIIIGASLYAVAILAMRVITKEDISQIARLIFKKN